jgi:hypothetical protein
MSLVNGIDYLLASQTNCPNLTFSNYVAPQN